MSLEKLRKKISRFFGWLVLKFCSLTVKILPEGCLYALAKIIGHLAYLVLSKHRRIALDSLSIAFGKEKPSCELKKIAKDCFSFMAKSSIELLFLKDRPKLLKSRVTIQNKHILDEALLRQKGVILVSGHFGNFPLMMLRLRLEGYSIGGIMRPMRQVRVERMFSKIRDEFGIKTIYSQPKKACVDSTIRALRNNEIICIQLDQNFGTGGVFVNFFGKKAATAKGPVVFALRTEAALLPCFIIREKNYTQRIIFEPEFNLKQEGNFDKQVQINTQRLTAIIESYIRRYPSHWGWIHRRWKTRPRELST